MYQGLHKNESTAFLMHQGPSEVVRTGPVNTFADLVDHVPTNCLSNGRAAKTGTMRSAPVRSTEVGRMVFVVQYGCGVDREERLRTRLIQNSKIAIVLAQAEESVASAPRLFLGADMLHYSS